MVCAPAVVNAVVSVAVQIPGVELVPAVAVQVAAVPRLEPASLNCTVPVGPAAPFVVPVTLAVRVTLPPVTTLVTLGVTTVEVTCVPVALIEIGPEVEV